MTSTRFSIPAGHGPLWDLAEDRDSIALIERLDAGESRWPRSATRPRLRRAKGPMAPPW